jgi:ubiquinone/menaquinone biosynthesis C-methylase UbiE
MTLNRVLQRVAACPGGYDALQWLAGRPLVADVLRKWLANERGLLIDVGGGTGTLKALLPAAVRHVCVEPNPAMLSGYVAKFHDGLPLNGDAVRLPVRDGAAPLVALIAVSHHLTDAEFDEALSEIARIQAPRGSFFFFDALLVPERLASRFMWRRDRGAHPRTAADIIARLQRHFEMVEHFEYSLWHRYLACRCRPL